MAYCLVSMGELKSGSPGLGKGKTIVSYGRCSGLSPRRLSRASSSGPSLTVETTKLSISCTSCFMVIRYENSKYSLSFSLKLDGVNLTLNLKCRTILSLMQLEYGLVMLCW